jgi:hypothetical protein
MHNIQQKHTAHITIVTKPCAGHHFENLDTDEMTVFKYIFKNKVYMCGLNPTGYRHSAGIGPL